MKPPYPWPLIMLFFLHLNFFYKNTDDEAKGEARAAPLLSSTGVDGDHSPVPRYSRQRRSTLGYLSPLFFSCYISIHCHCGTAAFMHACMGLRGTACPGSSCSAILPIIKNGVQYDFPWPPRFLRHCFGCFPFITALPLVLEVFYWSSKGTLVYHSLCCSSLLRLFLLSVYLLASNVFNYNIEKEKFMAFLKHHLEYEWVDILWWKSLRSLRPHCPVPRFAFIW